MRDSDIEAVSDQNFGWAARVSPWISTLSTHNTGLLPCVAVFTAAVSLQLEEACVAGGKTVQLN